MAGLDYTTLVNHGWTGAVASKVGLPRPAILRRVADSGPLVPGPVLVLGDGAAADSLAAFALGWELDVRRVHAAGVRWGGIIVDLTSVEHPQDLSTTVLALAPAVRELARGGRVIVIARPAEATDSPAPAAAREGVAGFVRSLAKELRGGATANLILLANGVDAEAPSVRAATRFFLSARSSFVDGQPLLVTSAAGGEQDDDAPLRGRVAVVTGAARGIGAAIARTLHRDGATLVLVDVPAAGEELTRLANELAGTALQLDITAPDAGVKILDHATARHGSLDIVVHNAGITRDKLFVNTDAARWDPVIEVNLAAQLRIDEQLLASGRFTDAPRIISISSTSGIAGNRGQTNYATTKAGIIGMVRATSPLLAEHGGTANAIAPGFIETEMTAHMPFATREVARRLNSLQQGGLPQDVAEGVAFLASPAAGGIQGQVLRVCGQNLVGA